MAHPGTHSTASGEAGTAGQSYGDLSRLSTSRLILDAVGGAALAEIAEEFLGVLGTSCAVYERNGDYALGIFSSGWCRLLDEASFRRCGADDPAVALNSGRWLCHESCWRDASAPAIATGEPVDVPCHGGIRLYAVPIVADGEVVGSINLGYGDPPSSPESLQVMADTYGVEVAELRQAAGDHPRRAPAQVADAKRRLHYAARLIGLMVERFRAQQQALASSERYRLLVETMGQGVLFFDDARVVSEANPAARRILGRTAAELTDELQRGDLEMLDADGNPVPADQLPGARALREGRRTEGEVLGVRNPRDGQIHWVRSEIVPIEMAPVSGERRQFYVVLSDITEQRRSEAALRESEDRLRLSMQAANQGFYDLDLETGDAVVSPEYATMLGYDPESFQETNARWLERLHPDDRPRVEQVFRDYVAGRIPEYSVEFRQRTAQGDWKWVWSLGRVVEWAADGSPLRFMGTHTDIGRRKRAEAALVESETRFRQAFEAAPIPIGIAAADGRIELFNRAFTEMFGYTLEDIQELDQWFRNAYPDPAYREQVISRWEADLAVARERQRPAEPMEVEVVCKDGTRRTLEVFGSFIGERLVAIFTDLTERKEAEEERRRAEEQMRHVQKLESLGVLAGGIAHDFNNLLMAMLGSADLALDTLEPTHPARGLLGDIETAAQRAAELCRQMLAYAGKGRFVLERVDLSQLVREMGQILHVSVSKSAALRYDLADELPPVEADASQLRQVVMNLITNASEAVADQPGVVSVQTGVMSCDHAYLSNVFAAGGLPEGRYVFLEVADTGAGMDAGTRERIFDPFFTTKFTGRGLGLAATQGIVHGHKGAIKVYSEPGRGSTFKVLLPAAEGATDAAGDAAGSQDAWSGSGTVLLADDEPHVRAIVTKMLERLGFKVVCCADGEEAVQRFRSDPDQFDLVLLDLTMPRMGGEEAFRELRRCRADVRVILSSGYNEQEVTQRFAGKGHAGFVQKPYTLASLRAALAGVLGIGSEG